MAIRTPTPKLPALGGLGVGNTVHRARRIVADQHAAIGQLLHVHRPACRGLRKRCSALADSGAREMAACHQHWLKMTLRHQL